MPKQRSLIFLALTLGVGAILFFQLFNLTSISLWHDEAFSALLVQQGFGEMIERIGQDVHPPLYYILLRPWADTLGTSLFSLRFFSFVFGLLTVAGTYFLAREIFRKRSIALLSSLFVFFNAFQIQYNMEARMYTLGSFFVVASSLLLLKGLKTKGRVSLLWWLGYAATAAAGIYTHYYVGFVLLSQGIFALYWIWQREGFKIALWMRNTNFRLLLFSSAFVLLSYLPWLPTFLRQVNQVQNAFWIPPMTIWSIPTTLFKMLTGFGIDPERFSLPLLAGGTLALVLGALFLLIIRYSQKSRWLLISALVIPFLASVLLSLRTSIYLDRYFIFFLPFLLMGIAAAVLSIKISFLRRSLLAILTVGALASFPLYWQSIQPEEKPGMAAAARYLNESVQSQDKLFINSSFVYFTFTYYNQTSLHPLLYAPSALPHFSGTALLDDENILKDFERAVKDGDTVWTVDTTGFGNLQPAVPSSWTKESEAAFQDTPDFKGEIIVRKYRVE